LSLTEHFDSITISSEAGWAKPNPDIFRLALGRHSIAAAEAIHVGDSFAHDVAGALAAGVTPILLDPTASSRTRVEGRITRVAALDAVSEAIDEMTFP
jgi:putative hydrolase of the HAD superfamily